MALPKYRTSRARKKIRRSHHALKKPGFVVCDHCGALKQAHCVCLACGHYKGRKVIDFDAAEI